MPGNLPFVVTLLPSLEGNAGAFQTIKRMRALVEAFKIDPEIIDFAAKLIRGIPQRDHYAEVNALFLFVRDQVRYMLDVFGVEVIATPLATLKRRCGDCDDKATLLATLFEAAGFQTRFVMGAYQSNEFEHVYLHVCCAGEWIAADAILSEPLGFEVPIYYRLWIEGA